MLYASLGRRHTALGVLSPLGDLEDALPAAWDSLLPSHHVLLSEDLSILYLKLNL